MAPLIMCITATATIIMVTAMTATVSIIIMMALAMLPMQTPASRGCTYITTRVAPVCSCQLSAAHPCGIVRRIGLPF